MNHFTVFAQHIVPILQSPGDNRMPSRRVVLFVFVWLTFQQRLVSGFEVTRKGHRCEVQVSLRYIYDPSYSIMNEVFLKNYDLILRLIDSDVKTEVDANELDWSWCPEALGASNNPIFAVGSKADLLKPLHDCACARFRPYITSKVLGLYQCDLPAAPQALFFKALKRKANRYNQIVRFQLALLRDARAVQIFDDLMASCFNNYIDEQILSITGTTNLEFNLTAITSAERPPHHTDSPATTTANPKPLSSTTEPTQQQTKRPSRKKTPPPTQPPTGSTDGSAIASTSAFSPIDEAPPRITMPTMPQPASSQPESPPGQTKGATAAPVPIPSEVSIQLEKVEPTKAVSNDASEGTNHRLATEFNEMNRQLAAIYGALTLVLVLMLASVVLAVGIFAWRNCRARNTSSEYQPLFPVHPSLDSTD